MSFLEVVKQNTIVNENGCWDWQMSFSSNGYPQKKYDGKIRSVHRYLAEELGIITNLKEVVRHKCNRPSCCNPEHLISGTHKDNYQDSIDVYKCANIKSRGVWSINNKTYDTIRHASKETGLPQQTIITHTHNGVFDTATYRDNCIRSGRTPKV